MYIFFKSDVSVYAKKVNICFIWKLYGNFI